MDKLDYIAIIKPYGISEEDELKVIVDKDIMDNIEGILRKYHVEEWNGFNKVNKNVLDGDDFSLSVKMVNDEEIYASGYMSWPKNYRNVIDGIDEIFMKIYNDNKK